MGEAEGAKFWLGVLTELRNRGVQDILIAAIDGLGIPEQTGHRLRSKAATDSGAIRPPPVERAALDDLTL